jgi:hypothetical protein
MTSSNKLKATPKILTRRMEVRDIFFRISNFNRNIRTVNFTNSSISVLKDNVKVENILAEGIKNTKTTSDIKPANIPPAKKDSRLVNIFKMFF